MAPILNNAPLCMHALALCWYLYWSRRARGGMKLNGRLSDDLATVLLRMKDDEFADFDLEPKMHTSNYCSLPFAASATIFKSSLFDSAAAKQILHHQQRSSTCFLNQCWSCFTAVAKWSCTFYSDLLHFHLYATTGIECSSAFTEENRMSDQKSCFSHQFDINQCRKL